MKSALPRLPDDVWEDIVDDICADIRSLHNVSLVRKAWTPMGQRRLFKSVKYSNYDPKSPTPDDLAFFISASPHIAQYIHALELRCCKLQLATLLSILSCLPNLRELIIGDRVHLLDDRGDALSPDPRRMGPLETFCFNECEATSVILHYLLSLFRPCIPHVQLRNRTWTSRDTDNTWKLYDPSGLPPLDLAVDTLSVYNVPWEMISAMLRHNTTVAKTITELRLRTLYEYYQPTAVGRLLAELPSLRHFQLGPYFPITMDELQAHYPQGKGEHGAIASISQYFTNSSTAFSELQLHRCQQLDIVEFSFCWKSHATEMLPHLEMFMDADLPTSVRELRFSFFFTPSPWCCAPPRSPEELAAWARLDCRMLNTPSHVQLRVVYAGDGGENLLTHDAVSPFRAFCDGVLPMVTAKGRLSVLSKAFVPPGAPRHCRCYHCMSVAT